MNRHVIVENKVRNEHYKLKLFFSTYIVGDRKDASIVGLTEQIHPNSYSRTTYTVLVMEKIIENKIHITCLLPNSSELLETTKKSS